MEFNKSYYYWNETYRVLLGLIFLTVSAIIAMMLNEKMNENISDMMIVIQEPEKGNQ